MLTPYEQYLVANPQPDPMSDYTERARRAFAIEAIKARGEWPSLTRRLIEWGMRLDGNTTGMIAVGVAVMLTLGCFIVSGMLRG